MTKVIIISAPSGAGKTSIAHYLLSRNNNLSFSISACSRQKRQHEVEGEDYYFLTVNSFKQKIAENKFLEWEEVYKNQFYGTLKSEIQRIWGLGKHVILDLDVVGALNMKNEFNKDCLAIFIMPPSIQSLKERLNKRASESADQINIRIQKAKQEISKSKNFDHVILNDHFEKACKEVEQSVKLFLG